MNSLNELKHFVIKTFLLSLVLGAVIAFISTSWLPYKGEQNFEYGPILSWVEDPRTTVTISWGWEKNMRGYVLYWNETFRGKVEVKGSIINVTLRNLSPDTIYNYVIGYYENERKVNWTKVYQFKTAPLEFKPFTFLVHTDTQMHETGLGCFEKFVEIASKEDFDFMIHIGDLVQADKQYRMWERFLKGETKLACCHPLIATPGNHEYLEYGKNEARNYKRYLALPGNEFWYTFNYSNVVFVALGVYDYENFSMPKEEIKMLEKALSDTSKWRIVYFHIPAVEFYYGTGVTTISRSLFPLINKCKPDLVLMGHVHGYARANINDTTYVTLSSVGGIPAPLLMDDKSVDYYYFNYGYAIVKVNGNNIDFYFKDLDGNVIDHFTLTRG